MVVVLKALPVSAKLFKAGLVDVLETRSGEAVSINLGVLKFTTIHPIAKTANADPRKPSRSMIPNRPEKKKQPRTHCERNG